MTLAYKTRVYTLFYKRNHTMVDLLLLVLKPCRRQQPWPSYHHLRCNSSSYSWMNLKVMNRKIWMSRRLPYLWQVLHGLSESKLEEMRVCVCGEGGREGIPCESNFISSHCVSWMPFSGGVMEGKLWVVYLCWCHEASHMIETWRQQEHAELLVEFGA